MRRERTALQALGTALALRSAASNTLHAACTSSSPGALLSHARHSTLFSLVTRARRFFPSSAASEVWSTLRPGLLGDPNSSPAHVALGWLVLFFPTKALPLLEPEVTSHWVSEWMAVWRRLVHCSYWDSHWMYLLARAVKDDWKGAPHASKRLLTRFKKHVWPLRAVM